MYSEADLGGAPDFGDVAGRAAPFPNRADQVLNHTHAGRPVANGSRQGQSLGLFAARVASA